MKLPRIYWLDACIWGALVVLAVMFVSRKFSGPRGGRGGGAADLPLVGAGDGQRFRLEEQRGKPVVIEVFAGWCGACKRSSPALVEAYQRNGGVSFLGVSMDELFQRCHPRVKAGLGHSLRRRLRRRRLGRQALRHPRCHRAFILIGKDGIVRRVFDGRRPGPKEVTGWLSRAVAPGYLLTAGAGAGAEGAEPDRKARAGGLGRRGRRRGRRRRRPRI